MNQNKNTDFPELGISLQKFQEILMKKQRITRGDLKNEDPVHHTDNSEKLKETPKPQRKKSKVQTKDEISAILNKIEETVPGNVKNCQDIEKDEKLSEPKRKSVESKKTEVEKKEENIQKIEESLGNIEKHEKKKSNKPKEKKEKSSGKNSQEKPKREKKENKEGKKHSSIKKPKIQKESEKDTKQEDNKASSEKKLESTEKNEKNAELAENTKKSKKGRHKSSKKMNEIKKEEFPTIILGNIKMEEIHEKKINEENKEIKLEPEKIEIESIIIPNVKKLEEKNESFQMEIETTEEKLTKEYEKLESEEKNLKEDAEALKVKQSVEKLAFEKSLKASTIFEDLEVPIYSNFFENEDQERIFSKALCLLTPNFLHSRLVKIVHKEQDCIKIRTNYIKKKQKTQKNLCCLSDNTYFNQEEDLALILQEPAFYPIDSEEKFKKIFDGNALEHFQEGFENLVFHYEKLNHIFNKKIIFWPVLIMQNYCRKNAAEFVSDNISMISDDSYLNLEFSNKKINQMETEQNEVIVNKIENEILEPVVSNSTAMEEEKKEDEEEKIKTEMKNEEKMEIEKKNFNLNSEDAVLIYYFGTNFYEIVNVNDVKRMSMLDINNTKEFFYKNQFLKAIFSEYIRIIKEYNGTIEKNKNQCLSGKMKHYNLRIIKISKKGESDMNGFFSILLHSKNLEDGKVYILVKRLDNLQLEWICISNEEEKFHLTTDLNYPILNGESLMKLYTYEDSNRKRVNYCYNNKKIINLLLEFFYTSNHLYHCNLYDKSISSFARIDEDLKEKVRCKICKYIIGDLDVLYCEECASYYHFQCLPNHQYLPNKSSEIYKNWVCKDCSYCQICYNKTKKESMITCHKCTFSFHKTCVFITNVEDQNKLNEDPNAIWFCHRCLICDYCEKKFETNVFQDNSLLCNQCKGFREKKEFCRVCNKPWIKPSVKIENKKLLKDWILCSLCCNWIHRFCDNSLREDKTYSEFVKSNKDYSCPLCRNEQTNQKLKEFINILTCLDVNKYFLKPVDAENVPYYKKVVNEPMDFETMLAKASSGKYLEDPFNLIKKDFDLICDNALLFNFPKSHIHIEAKKLKIIGAYSFEYFKKFLINTNEMSTNTNTEEIKKLESEFLENVDLYYFNILFSNENDPNKNTKILQKTKPLSIKKTEIIQNLSKEKEIIIEISGLNYILEAKDPQIDQLSIIKSEVSNNPTNKEKTELESPRNLNEIDIEETKSKSPVRNEQKAIINDPYLRLKNKSIFHTFEEMILKLNNNKPFYFHDPVLVSFNDYSLLEADNCLLCGAFANNEDLLTCYYCQENYHPYCLYSKNYNKSRYDQIKSENLLWICPNCKLCEKCNKPPEHINNLFCHSCEKFYHLNCAYNNVGVMPGLTWKCENCFECALCHTKEFFSEKIDTATIHYEFCEDFKYCYECGILESFKNFCKFCKKYIPKSTNPTDKYSLCYLSQYEDHLECTRCQYKFHKNCYKEDLKESIMYDEEIPIDFDNQTENFICQECEWSSEDKQREALELQEKLMFDLTQLKKKNIVFKFNFDITKTILDSNFQTSIKIPNYETESQNLIQEFITEYAEFYENKEYLVFINNLKIIAKLSTIPHQSKNKKKKQFTSIFENKEFDFFLDFQIIQNKEIFSYFSENEEIFFDHRFNLSCNDSFFPLFFKNTSSFVLYPVISVFFDQNFIAEKIQESKWSYLDEFSKYISYKTHNVETDYMTFCEIFHDFEWEETLINIQEIKFGLILLKDELKVISLNHLIINEDENDLIFFNNENEIYKKKRSSLLVTKNYGIYYNPFWVGNLNEKETLDNKIFTEKKEEFDDLINYENHIKEKISNMFEKFLDEKEIKKLKKEHKSLNNSNGNMNEEILKSPPKAIIPPISNIRKIMTALKEDPVYSEIPKVDLIPGPFDDIKCILCRLEGERKILGRLLNNEVNKWVHANCALWSSNVFENMEGGLIRFQSSCQKSLHLDCDFCQQKGASLQCSKFKTCKKKYHFNCAIEAECLFLRDKNILCKSCFESGNSPDLSIISILKDFQTERRLYIVDSQFMSEREISKKFKNFPNLNLQEKCAPFHPGAFHRFGSLIVLNISKIDINDPNRGFDEYLIIRRVTNKETQEKKMILILLYQNKKQYFINSKIMDSNELISIFETKKNIKKKMEIEGKSEKNINVFELFQNGEINQFFIEFYQKALKIEDVYSLWEIISEIMHMNINSIQIDNIIDFIAKFLGLNNTNIKRWLKFPIDSIQIFKRNCSGLSFFQNFFLKNLEEMNPFEKQQIVDFIYNEIKTESCFPGEKTEKNYNAINPKNIPLKNHSKIIMIKENKRRKSESSISDFNIKVDELINEPKINLEAFHLQPIKVQNEKEMEKKLKQEYMTYKKRAAKGVYVAPSNIHKYGLFAINNFKKYDIIIEYVGEVIRNVVADKREEIYKDKGFGDCYMFRIDKDYVVDATFNGNQARYLNHSCEHNCASYILQIGEEKKIIMYANKDIGKGEEITYDYQFDLEAEKLKCTCGSKSCQGRLN